MRLYVHPSLLANDKSVIMDFERTRIVAWSESTAEEENKNQFVGNQPKC